MSSTVDLVNEEKSGTEFKKLTLSQKIIFIKNAVTIEPLMVCYLLPSFLASLAVKNLGIQMACYVNLGYNDTICSNLLLDMNKKYEENVSVQVTSMIQWQTPLNTSIPAILVLFFGSYSDRHKKRKPFFIMPLIGEFLSTLCFILCALNIKNWRMEIEGLAESLFPALSGGLTIMLMAVYSYIADVTTIEDRTLRIGIIHIISSVVSLFGNSLSGVLYEYIGFFGLFPISLVLYIIGFSYVMLRIHEPTTESTQTRTTNLCADLFNPQHILQTFVILFKKRKGSERFRIILLMFTFIVIVGPTYGEASIAFYFTRIRFQWSAIEYSFYAVYDVIIHLIGSTIAITVLSKWWKVDDLLIAALACTSKVAASFLYAFSTTPTLFYFAPIVSIFSGSGAIMMRSIATKLVSENELGKIQSLFGICDAVAPIIYSIIYVQVYIATVNVLPGAFFLMGALLIAPATFIFLAMYVLQKRDEKENNNEMEIKQDSFKYVDNGI